MTRAEGRKPRRTQSELQASTRVPWLLPVFGLIVLLALSAFGLVYVKDLSRRLFIQVQKNQQQRQVLDVNYGRLLLEQSAWSTQSRIQQFAQSQLGMIAPMAKDVVMVRVSPTSESA